ncbi:major facilitator superfamily domain-containing protein [Aspergillus unguis]
MESEKNCQTPDGKKAPEATLSVSHAQPPTSRTITFGDCPKKNPYNWPFTKKLYVVVITLLCVMNSGVSSSLPTNATPYIMEAFDVTDDSQSSLPSGIFLIGYVVGPLIWSPLSEMIGRRPVLLYTFIGFFLFTLADALAPGWSTLLFFRFVCGCMGAAPQTVIGGCYADVFLDKARGRAMAFYMAVASFGPLIGPIISGFASEHGWRWSFWIDLIFAGVTLVGLAFLPESFGPAVLRRHAAKLSKMSGENISAPSSKIDTDIKTIFLRPIHMLLFEPIVLFTSLYVGIVYGLVFFFFQAYPIIFPDVYGLSIKMTSLAFLPIGVGAASTALVAIYWDNKYGAAVAKNRNWLLPFTPELHRLPIGLLGGIFISISLFWLAWTADPNIHWIVPMLSGLFFGFGYQSIFTALLIYVTDAYKVYSASALASSVIVRSSLGVALPVAAKPMYNSLGVGWATSLLGFVSLACVPIPFVLLWKGQWIRDRSRFCQVLNKVEAAEAESRNGSHSESMIVNDVARGFEREV